MFCPHCHNKIPDGSNICPLCYSNLAGVKPQPGYEEPRVQEGDAAPAQAARSAPAKPRKSTAYTKGSRGGRKSADRTPMIIAFGLIVILVVIIVMIVRSMFGAGSGVGAAGQPTAVPQATSTPAQNFIIFGATATPAQQQVAPTPTPAIEITPTPAPQTEVTYKTLRKNDQGPEVMLMQKALVELGYLSGATDGIFGTGTQTAVKKFQEDNGLSADGIAGKQTLEALYSRVPMTPIPDATAGPGDILDLPG